jgi:hypothetical protein
MGRMFELRRPYRSALAAAAVLATGLISYATVLNAHVPAATLVLGAAACLIHATVAVRKPAGIAWTGGAGLCAALAFAIDPASIWFGALFLGVIAAARWHIGMKVSAAVAYAACASVPILLHASLTASTTGDVWQGMSVRPATPAATIASADPYGDDEEKPNTWPRRLVAAVLGAHGLLSHFPVLLLGAIGVGMVMHRHWTTANKVLASATVAASAAMVVTFAVARPDWRDWREAAFAARWFVVFTPLLLFWAGAWLRRPHRRWTWGAVTALLVFSTTVSIIGAAAGPVPPNGFNRYTAAAAWSRLVSPPSGSTLPPTPALAGR